MFVVQALIIPHLAFYLRDTYFASGNSTLARRMEFDEYHPLIREALESQVKKCTPALYAYLRDHRVPIVFADLPDYRDSQRVVTLSGSYIEVSRKYECEGTAQKLASVTKIARYLIHEATHCQRLDASNLLTLIYQQYRYAFGMLREERSAYEAERALGFGAVQVKQSDIADEQHELLQGLLARTAMGFLLIALYAVWLRARERARTIPVSPFTGELAVVHHVILPPK